MKKVYFLFIATLITSTSFAQTDIDSLILKGGMAAVKATKFTSAINHHDYTLLVKLPPSYDDTIKKIYPVLYALDGQWTFTYLMEIQNALLYDNLSEELIYIGIAFPQNYFANRNRDFTPTHTDFDSASGGAPKFLNVIQKEIIPYIDSSYRTDKKNNGLLGGSSGGLFVLYALLQQPSRFNRFIANSPSLFYDNELISKMEKTFAKKNRELPAKLFLSSGGYEEANDPPFFKNFIAQLKASDYKGLEMDSLIVDKTGHLTNGFYADIRGLEFVYGKPDMKVDTLLLNEYAGNYEHDIKLLHKGNALYFSGFGKEIKLNAATDNNFYVIGVNGIIEFARDEKNKVTGFKFDGADSKMFIKKVD